MSLCMYNGKRLIPCPYVTLNKSFQRLGDGTLIGTTWQGTIRGKIITHMGSPDKNGDFWMMGGYPTDDTVLPDEKLGVIFRKQEAIRTLFSEDGHMLEFQSLDGSAPMKCNPRITGITFDEGDWVTKCEFTITFDADIIYVNNSVLGEDNLSYYIRGANESWQFEVNEGSFTDINDKTYRLTHEVNAEGKRIFESDGSIVSGAWELAREYVRSRIGLNYSITDGSSINGIGSGYVGYNHVRSENINPAAGSYGVTESWLMSRDTAIESFTIVSTVSDDNGLTAVNIDGSIEGVEIKDSNMNIISNKYTNALSKYNTISSGTIYTRAKNYSGANLNILPLQSNVTRSPYAGSISYSYQYNDRPSNLIPGALSEVFSVQDSFDNDIIAILPVPFRAKGPILQDVGTKAEKTRTVSVEVVMPIPSGGLADRYAASPYSTIDTIVNELKPTGYQVFQIDNSPSWDFSTGRFSLNRQWTYEDN